MSAPFEVETGSATLCGEVRGNGPTIIFLHAGVADRRMWAPQLAAFEQTHQVVAYDRRGFGESTTIDAPFRHVDDLAAVLDHLGVEEAALCGCSQGARMALILR